VTESDDQGVRCLRSPGQARAHASQSATEALPLPSPHIEETPTPGRPPTWDLPPHGSSPHMRGGPRWGPPWDQIGESPELSRKDSSGLKFSSRGALPHDQDFLAVPLAFCFSTLKVRRTLSPC
jgi:hypothetical protein